ncbi:MAG: hypothetical protein RLN86_04035 [Cyclobacteriaceae bacterium]
MKNLLTIIILFAFALITHAQKFNEVIKESLQFEKQSESNALIVANINGNVTVVAHDGPEILVEVEKQIVAKTDQRLEKGKREVQLGIIDLADTLILFVKGPCTSYGQGNQKYHRNEREGKGWNYNWSGHRDNCMEDYNFKLNFKIMVPSSVNVHLSTINDGNIEVSGVKAQVYADNINGSIKLTKIAGATSASTINGDLDLEYEVNPKSDCRFYSLNGDINAFFQKGLGASVSFESFNGDFFTNVNTLESLPVQLEKETRKEGTKYKINGNRYKVGPGGVRLDFETFNGNVYLKEI